MGLLGLPEYFRIGLPMRNYSEYELAQLTFQTFEFIMDWEIDAYYANFTPSKRLAECISRGKLFPENTIENPEYLQNLCAQMAQNEQADREFCCLGMDIK